MAANSFRVGIDEPGDAVAHGGPIGGNPDMRLPPSSGIVTYYGDTVTGFDTVTGKYSRIGKLVCARTTCGFSSSSLRAHPTIVARRRRVRHLARWDERHACICRGGRAAPRVERQHGDGGAGRRGHVGGIAVCAVVHKESVRKRS